MKIAIADNCGGKFSEGIKNHFIRNGHDVKFERGASEHLAQWADLYYVDFWDNNIHYLYKLYNGDPDRNRPLNWDNSKKPRIVVRAIDWEVWIGFARDQRIIDWVDDVIVIAPHIEQELRKHADFGNKIHLIRPGVDLTKFTVKTSKTDGFQLGMVLGDMWWPKNHMGGLDIFTSLYQKDSRWRLHIRGQHEGGNDFWKQMYEHYLDSRGIRDVVTLYGHVEDMNAWYENIDVLLHPGMKEAFCYAVGEAMAKGIPAFVNDFFGSEHIWSFRYRTHEEAIMYLTNFAREKQNDFIMTEARKVIRSYIEERYSLERMMQEYDTLLNT
jgi:glycosyltransferase involved in cell wall biosynthesis